MADKTEDRLRESGRLERSFLDRSRSKFGWEPEASKAPGNIGIFTSLTQTEKLQESSILDLFRNLLTGTAAKAQDILFTNSS